MFSEWPFGAVFPFTADMALCDPFSGFDRAGLAEEAAPEPLESGFDPPFVLLPSPSSRIIWSRRLRFGRGPAAVSLSGPERLKARRA